MCWKETKEGTCQSFLPIKASHGFVETRTLCPNTVQNDAPCERDLPEQAGAADYGGSQGGERSQKRRELRVVRSNETTAVEQTKQD